MLDALVVLAAFVGSWVGYYRWARRKKNLSIVISAGGGFIVGCVATIIATLIIAPESAKKTEADPVAQADVAQQPKVTAEQAAADARKKRIERGFSAWDGSHRELEAFIKKAMNDPDSYSHVETVWWDRGDHLVVRTTYRGKNAFGGVVKEWVKAKASLDGELLEVIEYSAETK